jgi:hypothetical protein
MNIICALALTMHFCFPISTLCNADSTKHKELLDTTFISPYDFAIAVEYQPEITIPDSLLPLGEDVKVWVQVKIDPVGIPRKAQIIKSSNERFDNVAKQFALLFRFDLKKTPMPSGFDSSVVIPLVFRKTSKR